MITSKLNWKLVLFGILFYGGLIYLSIILNIPTKTVLPDNISSGDTLLVTDYSNHIIKLKKL